MLSTATITMNLSDLLGVDYDARRTRVWVTTNAYEDTVIDTAGQQIRLGSGKVTVNADGTATATVWVPGTGSNPSTWQTYFHVSYPDGQPRGKQETRTFGPYTITASGDLSALEQQQVAAPTQTAANYATVASTSATSAATSATAAQTAQTAAETARDGAVSISGISTTDSAVQALVKNSGGVGPLTSAALSALFARRATIFELVNHTVYGHSYTKDGYVPDAAKFHARVTRRLGTQPAVINGVSGYRMQQAAAKAIATWTPGTTGLVELTCLVNDISIYQADTKGPPTTAAALRALLAMVSSGKVLLATSSPFAYSSGWTTSGGVTGRTAAVSSTPGSYVDVTFVGDTADLSVNLASTGGGLITATMGGTTLGTLDTSGYYEPSPGVLSLSALGAGSHTVRFTFTSGTNVSIDALYVRNPNPPTVAYYEEGWIINNGVQTSAQNTRLTSTYPAAVAPVLAAFPNVTVIPADATWDPTTMLVVDNIHPNELGHSYIADKIVAALVSKPAREGQNILAGPLFTYTGTSGGTATGIVFPGITDNFNRANAGSLGTTSDGNGVWASVNMYISGNAAVGSGGGGDSANTVDPGAGHSDTTVQATLVTIGTGGGIVARGTDNSNFWVARPVAGKWTIQKKVTGTFTTPTGGASTITPVDGDTVALVLSGTSVSLKVNGTQVATVTDAFNQTATKAGLFCPNAAPGPYPLVDNFSVL